MFKNPRLQCFWGTVGAITLVAIVVVTVVLVQDKKDEGEGGTTLTIPVVHMNDFHARYEETDFNGNPCPTNATNCIGGFARMHATITSLLAENPTAILLNGGDNFQGTLYYNIFKWNITQNFMNKLPWDAVVLGNHEFDDGIQGLVPFITSLKSPVVVANINDEFQQDFQQIYKKSVVVIRNGKKIGIIGVIVKNTNEISKTENLTFLDESDSVNAEAERLVDEEGVFTNIVLSHSGYELDKEIAEKATAKSKIGLIVGGHSHTFLSDATSGDLPGPVQSQGPYPTVIKRAKDSKQVLIVQASCFSRYVGSLSVSYDESGNVVEWSGGPIFLNSSHTPAVDAELKLWRDSLQEERHKILGRSLVTLDATNCRFAECDLGNFVTDAMVYSYTGKGEPDSWTYASLAVFNSGGLKATIGNQNITLEDVLVAQPYRDSFDVGEIQGQHIKDMFEFSMARYFDWISYNILQTSGFRVVADLSKPEGSRVESIKVRCNACKTPQYEDLDLNKVYRLIVNTFLKGGGDGFKVIQENLRDVKSGDIDTDVFVDYLEHRSPIFQEVQGRTVIKNAPSRDK